MRRNLMSLEHKIPKPSPIGSNHWYAQILTSWNLETSPSILVHFDSRRYLFNCGEGTQRICIEEKVRLKNLESIFLTRCSWQTCGGLPGMMMTVADAVPSPRLHIMGPPGTRNVVASCSSFLSRPGMQCRVDDIVEGVGVYEDENITVSSIPLVEWAALPQSPNSSSKLKGMFAAMERTEWDIPDRIVLPQKRKEIDPVSGSGFKSSAFILRAKQGLRAFNNKLAENLGVPRGRERGALTRGESITLEDGTVITPDMVTDPPKPGCACAIVDIPDVEHLRAVMDRNNLLTGLEVCILMLGPSVSGSDNYKTLIDKIKAQNPKMEMVLLDADFPDTTPAFPDSFSLQLRQSAILNKRRQAASLLQFFSPPSPTTRMASTILDFKKGTVVKKPAAIPEPPILPTLIDSRRESDNTITFLGTGSMIPSKYRNVSAILVTLANQSILLDCGESTMGQLLRIRGPQAAERDMRNLKCLYVSHMHADHHLGTLSVIEHWNRVNTDDPTRRLRIVSPTALHVFLKDMQRSMTVDMDRIDLTACNNNTTDIIISPQLTLATTLVEHCSHAYGCLLESPEQQIIYSGDCRPSESLVKLVEGRAGEGRRRRTLVHEATFESDMQGEAEKKRHSTGKEAVEMSIKMEAETLILTHFSQRIVPEQMSDIGSISAGSEQRWLEIEGVNKRKKRAWMASDGMQVAI